MTLAVSAPVRASGNVGACLMRSGTPRLEPSIWIKPAGEIYLMATPRRVRPGLGRR
jgi:hypothetical protein